MSNDDKQSGSPSSQALRPRARILRTLGEELISSETVALIELVKNSYDADAKQVVLKFADPLEGPPEDIPLPGKIEVIDNGDGMTLETVRSAWMEPATYQKKRETTSLHLQRRVLGEKGIGRFAASRLAQELELITRPRDSGREVYAIFDWTQFDDEHKYLDEILILTETREPEEIIPGGTLRLFGSESGAKGSENTHGTILRMTHLKRAWTRKHFEELQRGLSRLVSPFSSTTGFSISLHLPERFSDISAEVRPPAVIDYPHYTVQGSVDSDGSFDLSIEVKEVGQTHHVKGKFVRLADDPGTIRVLNESEVSPKNASFPLCGPFELELRVWDRDELGNILQQTRSTLRDTRKDLDAVAGVNIYRDGFRVLPYGEPNDDWLRLDLRRVQKPTHRLSNNQIAGYIAISSDQNPDLRDQSNREGLDDNQAFQDLRQIMLRILERLENVRYGSRKGEKRKGSSKSSPSLFDEIDFAVLRKRISTKDPDDKASMEIIDKVEQEYETQIRQIQSVLARYHSLATLGQLVDVLLHDGRHPISSIRNQALLGREDLEAISDSHPLFPTLKKRFNTIEDQGSVLHTVFRRVEPFGGRRRGRPTKLYLEKIIEESFDVLKSRIDQLRIQTKLPSSQTLVSVDDAEMKEVFTNLLTNSIYWLQQVDEERRKIVVTVERIEPNHVEVIFADSGPGIPESDRDKVFEPYYSTKPDGVGLGLSIAGEIVSDYYGGALELMDSGPLSGAVFRITLRKRV